MKTKTLNGISVYVANLGKYNEGELVGGWIDLPVKQTKLDKFLKETVGLELDSQVAFEKGMRGETVYEEYAIHDYDYDGGLKAIGLKPSEYTNVHDLNNLAWLIADLDNSDLEAINLFVENFGLGDKYILDYANIAAQVSNIYYYNYYFSGMEYCKHLSNEAKLGYSIAEDNGLYAQLVAFNAEICFDFKKYGEECSYDYVLGDYGYLDLSFNGDVDTELYSRKEIEELALKKEREIMGCQC